MLDIEEFKNFLLLKRGRSEGGIRTALSHWHAINGWLVKHRKPLNAESIEEFFIVKKKEGLTNGTLISYFTIVKLIELFTEQKLLNDMRLARPIRVIPDILTPDEVKRLLSVDLSYGLYGMTSCKRLNDVYKTLTELLYFTGCRIDEALRLKKKQLLAGSLVLFTHTKTGEERTVYLVPSCYQKLESLVENEKSDTLVFRNMKGHKIHGVEYRKDLKRRAVSAGITKRIHPHLLRHTAASHLAENSVDVRVVQKILGHSKLDSTIYYEQFNKDKQIDALNTLNGEQKEDLATVLLRVEKKLDLLLSYNKVSNPRHSSLPYPVTYNRAKLRD